VCPACNAWKIGMYAPVAFLVERAEWLAGEYGWYSPALLQRRLRVTPRMAVYLAAELQVKGYKTLSPQWSPLPPPVHR
jgi:hypothetical protein